MSHTAEPPQKRLLLLQAITSLHPGTGQSTGVVDLPIQREAHTRFPVYSASGLKGALRDEAEGKWGEASGLTKALFGSGADEQGQATTAGALAVTDARILAFPVRSLKRIFFWVTCPMVLERLRRDLELLDSGAAFGTVGEGPGEGSAWVHPDAGIDGELVLEEIALTASPNDDLKAVAERIAALAGAADGFDPKRFALVTNDDFGYFVQYATQVSARIRLNERKTTTGDGGNLWYEETLPSDTLLYALALCHRSRTAASGDGDGGQQAESPAQSGETAVGSAAWVADRLDELAQDRFLQIGGNETVGQGWCRLRCHGDLSQQEGSDGD